MKTISIKPCINDDDYTAAKQVAQAYIRWLDIDLTFQRIDVELSDFSSVST
jgi:hypothetical protein